MPQLTPVNSSNIAAAGYEAGQLTIQFQNGRTFRYSSVPEHVYSSMLQAPSAGKYFYQNIRNVYQYEEVNE